MFSWNKITNLTSKAGNITSKVKDFAKDLITVEDDNNEAFNQQFAQSQQEVQDSLSNQDLEIKEGKNGSASKCSDDEQKPSIQEIILPQLNVSQDISEEVPNQTEIIKHESQEVVIDRQDQSTQTPQSDKVLLQKKCGELQERLKSAILQIKEKENKIKELEKNCLDNDKNKRELIEEIKKSGQEIQSLKQKLKQKDQENSNTILQLQQMQKEFKQLTDLKIDLEQKDQEIEHLSNLLEEWQQENQQLQEGIQNIQNLNEQEQKKREILQTKYENDLKKAKNDSDQFQNLQRKFQDLHQELQLSKTQYQDAIQQLSQTEIKLQKLETSNKEMDKEIQAYHKKMKTDQMYQTNLVDRRVVSQFLICYFDPQNTFPVKMQILETLSGILGLSEQEKEKIGYFKLNQQIQNQKQNKQDQSQPIKQSFQSKLIGFLTEEQD